MFTATKTAAPATKIEPKFLAAPAVGTEVEEVVELLPRVRLGVVLTRVVAEAAGVVACGTEPEELAAADEAEAARELD